MKSTTGTALLRRRSRMTVSLALAGVCATVVAWNVAVDTPAAEAQEGRRVCLYLNGSQVTERFYFGDYPHDASALSFVGMNYTKDRGCPEVDPKRFEKNYGVAPITGAIEQVECEKWLGKIGATGKYHETIQAYRPLGAPGVDVCEVMEKDRMYQFSVSQEENLEVSPYDPEASLHKGDYTIESGSRLGCYLDEVCI